MYKPNYPEASVNFLRTVCGIVAALSLLSFSAEARPLLHFAGAQGPPVDVTDYEFTLPGATPLSVELSFTRADAERIRDLMQANLNSRLVVRIGATTVVTPVVRTVMAGSDLEVSVSETATYEAIKAALLEDLYQ
jgi:hypothetical protein